ncbi:uncharacterized protein B0T23DRAFT_84362 [Neurospora hispaniola]|uniref:Transmembrane protein n=1 Tax=Neurospora hispaniola TaxID=588809 RepID=A0AAJ0ID44_9PEZI|nr:hypothetical protein B0T23DRAFT_84362 [Neurospora hispaniola]
MVYSVQQVPSPASQWFLDFHCPGSCPQRNTTNLNVGSNTPIEPQHLVSNIRSRTRYMLTHSDLQLLVSTIDFLFCSFFFFFFFSGRRGWIDLVSARLVKSVTRLSTVPTYLVCLCYPSTTVVSLIVNHPSIHPSIHPSVG